VNLYEQQAANRRKTWLIMFAFVAFLFVLGLGFDTFYVGTVGGFPFASILALGVGSVSAIVSYFNGDKAVLLATGAKPIEEVAASAGDEAGKLRLRQLENVVDEMAIASGLPRPRVYVVPDDDPNAFATGRSPDHASIAVTRGLLNSLDREELQGVVAHEMSHIRNFDIRVMTIVAALVGAVALIADWSRRGMSWGGGRGRRDDDREGSSGIGGIIFFVIWIVAIVLAPLVAQMLAMMVSRKREYLADASGAELTRNPMGLARALEKIESAVAPTGSINRGSAHLCIADPLGRQVNLKEGLWSDLFASHPPMQARIAALKEMAFQR
jgi:heat shock protein HtpX